VKSEKKGDKKEEGGSPKAKKKKTSKTGSASKTNSKRKKPPGSGKGANKKSDEQKDFRSFVNKRTRHWQKRWVKRKLLDGRKLDVFKWMTEEKRKMSEGVKAVVGRKHTCSKCQKTFTDTSSLRKHAKIHGEKTFICQVEGCGKKFIDNSKLKRHQLVHTGERPYACPYPNCRKRFSLDFNLKSHLRIHTGEKPFVCKYEGCGKKFTQVSNLKAHKKTHLKKRDKKKGDSSEPSSPSDSPTLPMPLSIPVNSIPPLLPSLTGGNPDYNNVFPLQLSTGGTSGVESSLMAQLPGHMGGGLSGSHLGSNSHLGGLSSGNMHMSQNIPVGIPMLNMGAMGSSLGGNPLGSNVPPPIGSI